jgi:hypothetical protein
MRNRFILIAGLALLLLLVAIYLWQPGSAPRGQPPLLTLSSANLAEFQAAFDANAGAPRLVLLLSPT